MPDARVLQRRLGRASPIRMTRGWTSPLERAFSGDSDEASTARGTRYTMESSVWGMQQ